MKLSKILTLLLASASLLAVSCKKSKDKNTVVPPVVQETFPEPLVKLHVVDSVSGTDMLTGANPLIKDANAYRNDTSKMPCADLYIDKTKAPAELHIYTYIQTDSFLVKFELQSGEIVQRKIAYTPVFKYAYTLGQGIKIGQDLICQNCDAVYTLRLNPLNR
ncbi:hypothetical protein LX64_02846 [Chitinophaga skermanii]|uniref:Lipoprotein n=1 Tax=Chitinophaga skermanii TaxID=331697 RepID=A0A327QHF4_9BACT|nr:hypothetical protein [Chitinophaga skermanii]RAJ03969.1 hypothetical protein LX64_02846 [Chitinophaga skermanii]